MESKEESSSMRNIQEQEVVNIEHNSSKGSLKQRGQGDGDEKICEPLSDDIESFAQDVQTSADIQGMEHNDQQSTSIDHIERTNDVCVNAYEKLPSKATSSQSVNQVASGSKEVPNSNKSPEPLCLKSSNNINKTYVDKSNIRGINEPSTSGLSVAAISKCESTPINSDHKENKKRPSTLRLKRPVPDGEDSSSDTGNDDYSLGSEDGCIYTYRGLHMADLPSSFFSLDMGLPLTPNAAVPLAPEAAENPRPGSRVSSPDMDFLEMDFDPGPSCEADTGDDSTSEVDIEVVCVLDENELVIRGTSPEYQPGAVQPIIPAIAQSSRIKSSIFDLPSTSSENEELPDDCAIVKKTRVSRTEYITHVNVRGERFRVRRSMAQCPHPEPVTAHGSSGDLVPTRATLNYNEDKQDVSMAHQTNQGENATLDSVNLTTALYHVNMAKNLINDKTHCDEAESSSNMEPEAIAGPSQNSEPCVEAPRCMVWSEREACERQVTQIGTSACGATAVVNIFLALGVPVNIEKINAAVGTRQRANNAPIPRYLLSRSVAGCTAADLVNGIQRASDGLVTARFFPTYPERSISLLHWLADWISLGAVPILTLNLQLGCEGEMPDAWHHQMVFGVSPRGVYLCNPVECVPEDLVWSRLTSPSVLRVRARDLVSRFSPDTDMSPLTAVPDLRFHKLNVLGQVANVLREWRYAGCTDAETRTRHVLIPASYQAGVTIAALTGSEAHRRLMHAPPLPLHTHTEPT